jgi:hypothetical protein
MIPAGARWRAGAWDSVGVYFGPRDSLRVRVVPRAAGGDRSLTAVCLDEERTCVSGEGDSRLALWFPGRPDLLAQIGTRLLQAAEASECPGCERNRRPTLARRAACLLQVGDQILTTSPDGDRGAVATVVGLSEVDEGGRLTLRMRCPFCDRVHGGLVAADELVEVVETWPN